MNYLETTSFILLGLACLPFVLGSLNRNRFRPPRPHPLIDDDLPPVSVLIPARNEENNIGAAIASCLASLNASCEVIVLDDHSEDNTRLIVEDIARDEERISIHTSEDLPEGWSGKQYACYQLSKLAKFDHFLFLDADVRLEKNCIERVLHEFKTKELDLLSGFPRQITKTLMEKLVLPLIHFVLLGYLPFKRMRRTFSPAASAGCGQFFLTSREAYEATGGHSAIKNSSHDGVQLPRAYRRAKCKTDICDITNLAHVRMYQNAREVWLGLEKNATEGIGNPKTIIPMSILLFATVIPFPLLIVAIANFEPGSTYLLALACLTVFATRLLLSVPYRLSISSTALHPIGMSILLLIQWKALFKKLFGKSTTWKGREV